VAADGAHADARLALGNVRLEQGRPADALGEFEALIARNPSLPGARVGRGIARLRLGQTAEGIRLLEEAIELNPEPVRAHYELARAYEAAGDVARGCDPHAAEDTNGDGFLDTFRDVTPGSPACFDIIVKQNDTVMPLPTPQLFKATLHVLGDGFTELDTRDIFFLVPPHVEIIGPG